MYYDVCVLYYRSVRRRRRDTRVAFFLPPRRRRYYVGTDKTRQNTLTDLAIS